MEFTSDGLVPPAFGPAGGNSDAVFDAYFNRLFEPTLGLDGAPFPSSDSSSYPSAARAQRLPQDDDREPAPGERMVDETSEEAAEAPQAPSTRGRGRGRGGLPAAAAAPSRPVQRKAAVAAAVARKPAIAELRDDEDVGSEDDFMGDDYEDEGGGGAGAKRGRPADASERAVRSRERNREHARKSRLRKKFFIDGLKSNLGTLEDENQRLRAFAQAKLGLSSSELDRELSKLSSGPLPATASAGSKRAAAAAAAATAASASGTPVSAAPSAASDSRALPAVPITAAAALARSVIAETGSHPSTLLDANDFVLMQSLTKAQHNFCVSDPSLADNPIVFASAGFYELTGYTPAEIIGRNCRLLQGPGTDPAAVALISQGIREGRDTVVCLRNYRKDGTEFYNRVFVAPLRGADGQVVNYVGVQCEVKESIAKAIIAAQRSGEGGGDAATASGASSAASPAVSERDRFGAKI